VSNRDDGHRHSQRHARSPSATAAGLAALREAGATLFIHCGDIGGEEILELLADNHPAVCVWGNTDVDRVELSRYAAKLGIDCRGEFADLEFDGKKIAVTHGDDVRLMQRATGGQQYDYLLHGHTHVARDWRLGRLRIINPGAALPRGEENRRHPRYPYRRGEVSDSGGGIG